MVVLHLHRYLTPLPSVGIAPPSARVGTGINNVLTAQNQLQLLLLLLMLDTQQYQL
jgi:hypothetical protein